MFVPHGIQQFICLHFPNWQRRFFSHLLIKTKFNSIFLRHRLYSKVKYVWMKTDPHKRLNWIASSFKMNSTFIFIRFYFFWIFPGVIDLIKIDRGNQKTLLHNNRDYVFWFFLSIIIYFSFQLIRFLFSYSWN